MMNPEAGERWQRMSPWTKTGLNIAGTACLRPNRGCGSLCPKMPLRITQPHYLTDMPVPERTTPADAFGAFDGIVRVVIAVVLLTGVKTTRRVDLPPAGIVLPETLSLCMLNPYLVAPAMLIVPMESGAVPVFTTVIV